MKIKILQAGSCKQLERIAKQSGKWKNILFPATFVVIQHPSQGYILFDTGYSDHVFESMKTFPYNIYGLVTPISLHSKESAKEQLEALGINADEISIIILSHFHADHIGGCLDFPNAQFICSKQEYDFLKNKRGISALKQAFIPSLLPNNFNKRASFIENKTPVKVPLLEEIFSLGYDLLGDQSIVAINLSGHSLGQFGIFVQSDESPYFFVSDACWLSETYQILDFPSSITKLIMQDFKAYQNTLEKLHNLYVAHPEIKIIPTHDREVIKCF